MQYANTQALQKIQVSQTREELLQKVREKIIGEGKQITKGKVAEVVRDEGIILDEHSILPFVSDLHEEMVGLGRLTTFIQDESVTDIVVNGKDEIWIDRGNGLEQQCQVFLTEEEVRDFAVRLAASSGKSLDTAHPFVSSRLLSGIRFHAVLPPISISRVLISLRIPRKHTFTWIELLESGWCNEIAKKWLIALAKNKVSMLITGGTGSGKTTILGKLLSSVSTTERLLVIEDTNELSIQHPHVIYLEAQLANIEKQGEITMRQLVQQALRMRPDRLIVGEVRGKEIVELLSAMNTGHSGGCATLHANSAYDVISRVEALCIDARVPQEVAHSLMYAGLETIIHIGRKKGKRILEGIYVLDLKQLNGLNSLVVHEALVQNGSGDYVAGDGFQRLQTLVEENR